MVHENSDARASRPITTFGIMPEVFTSSRKFTSSQSGLRVALTIPAFIVDDLRTETEEIKNVLGQIAHRLAAARPVAYNRGQSG